MNKLLNIVSVLILTLTYSVSEIGFGLHHCLSSDDTFVLFLSSDLSCSSIHPEETCSCGDCCEGVSKETRFEDGDCQTEVFCLTLDQLISGNENFDFNSVYLISALLLGSSGKEDCAHNDLYYTDYDIGINSKKYRSSISVWRV